MKKVDQEPAAILCPPNDQAGDDLFDLNKLRLSQDYASTLGVKKALLTVPVHKPKKQDFFRVHPGDGWHLETMILELEEERETYLVGQNLWGELGGELSPKVLFTAINRQGVLILWPIRLPGADGRHNQWHQSALEAAEMAQKQWIRMVSNMSLGAYEVYQAEADIPEPEWPDTTFQEILKVAFKDRFIHDLSHPVVRRLRAKD
jgi:hypothetical protein